MKISKTSREPPSTNLLVQKPYLKSVTVVTNYYVINKLFNMLSENPRLNKEEQNGSVGPSKMKKLAMTDPLMKFLLIKMKASKEIIFQIPRV